MNSNKKTRKEVAFIRGQSAFFQGVSPKDNPWLYTNNDYAQAWYEGYYTGKTKLVLSFVFVATALCALMPVYFL